MARFFSLIVLAIVAMAVSGCAEQLTSDNSTSSRFNPSFDSLINEGGSLSRAQINALPLRPITRELTVMGGVGNRVPEKETQQIVSANLPNLFGSLGLGYDSSRARCGMNIDVNSLFEQIFLDRTDASKVLKNYRIYPVKFSEALETTKLVGLDPATKSCLKSQGRYVMLLRPDILLEKESMQLNSKDSFWEGYKKRVAIGFVRDPKSPSPQWHFISYAVIDTETEMVLALGSIEMYTLSIPNPYYIAYGDMEKGLGLIPFDYQKFKQAQNSSKGF